MNELTKGEREPSLRPLFRADRKNTETRLKLSEIAHIVVCLFVFCLSGESAFRVWSMLTNASRNKLKRLRDNCISWTMPLGCLFSMLNAVVNAATLDWESKWRTWSWQFLKREATYLALSLGRDLSSIAKALALLTLLKPAFLAILLSHFYPLKGITLTQLSLLSSEPSILVYHIMWPVYHFGLCSLVN